MRPNRPVGSCLVLVLLGSTWASSRGDDSAPLASLKAKGLVKSGRTFVVDAEAPVLAKIRDVRAALVDHARLAERRALAEQAAAQLSQLEERRAELTEGLNDLTQRINEQGFMQANGSPRQGPAGNGPQRTLVPEMIARRDQIKNALAEVAYEQKALKARPMPSDDRSATVEDARAKEEALKASLAELRPMVDEVAATYAGLGADDSVKRAIGELERASKVDFKLGPSDAFQSGVRAIAQAERRLLGTTTKAAVAARKKGRSRRP